MGCQKRTQGGNRCPARARRPGDKSLEEHVMGHDSVLDGWVPNTRRSLPHFGVREVLKTRTTFVTGHLLLVDLTNVLY